MSGYNQTIDNLVYHGIKTLRNQNEDHWQQLDDIARKCAETYNKPLEDVYSDYTAELRKQLLLLIYNV